MAIISISNKTLHSPNALSRSEDTADTLVCTAAVFIDTNACLHVACCLGVLTGILHILASFDMILTLVLCFINLLLIVGSRKCIMKLYFEK